jgi:hypothetical protein
LLYIWAGIQAGRVWELVASAMLLVAAVAGMNKWALTELWFTSRGPRWWREHRGLKFFHHISGEGEMMGIAVGILAFFVMTYHGHMPHVDFMASITLLGIMSAANLAVQYFRPILGIFEKIGGVKAVIIGGSVLSSLTGPAAAKLLSDYLLERVAERDRARVATGLAATIGSGNGLLPFISPPILIVWSQLQTVFHWDITRLILLVGIGCIIHVVAATAMFAKYVRTERTSGVRHESKGGQGVEALSLFIVTVVGNIAFAGTKAMAGMNLVLAIASYITARQRYRHCSEEQETEAFTAKYQPLILALLLAALDVIGQGATPLILALGKLIPTSLPLFVLAIILFEVTMAVSHFADNALASRVFMMIPASLIGTLGEGQASLLAASVITGALFGGFLTIPANLPNFVLAKEFGINNAGDWLKRSWKLYYTMPVYLAWIGFLFLVNTPTATSWLNALASAAR